MPGKSKVRHGRWRAPTAPLLRSSASDAVFARPQIRFVARRVGRSNCIESGKNGGAGGRPTFSVSTHDLRLLRAQPADGGGRASHSAVPRRFLGKRWNYVFRPDNAALRLKAAVEPFQVLKPGSAVRLSIGRKLMVATA